MPTLEQITARIREFRDERDWMQFDNPKDMAIAISLEASELLAHFLWKDSRASFKRAEERISGVREEIADVAIYLFEMADILGIDLLEAVEDKLRLNAEKYPVAKAKGRSDKYSEI
jgi:NTP pyrophosphatase (non-canonical NTP hydrolase)